MSETESSCQQPLAKASLREMVTDALRYWEPRRLIYNAVLALIVIGYFCRSLPESRAALSFDGFLFVFILAVLANLCYCAAYIADIFAQFSGFRVLWLRWRWLLLALGIIFAGIITRFFALGFFSSHHA